MSEHTFKGIMAGLADALAWSRGDTSRGVLHFGWMVEGGVYTDTSFTALEPGTQESHGPFDTYEKALMVWSGAMRANVDNCCHRLVIRQMER